MAYLIDTSILVRLANTSDVQYRIAANAALELHRSGEILNITPQVLIEFRNAATRPKKMNGVGLSIEETEGHAATFEARFPLLPETPDVYPAWKKLVTGLRVIGKQVHDARLVAFCHVHGVTHLLTFNIAHFRRMAAFGPGVIVVDPASL
jgi:predicted nucleic acid-binding protein